MIKTYKKGEIARLSENFNSGEFDCQCKYKDCVITYIDIDLVNYLQNKRTKLQRSIDINSGFRCTKRNHDVKGKSGSIHLIGKAADIVIAGLSVSQMADICQDADGLGVYPKSGFVHVDVRGYKARWKE